MLPGAIVAWDINMNFQKTPLGNNSTKHPTYGMTWKRAYKIERIARLSADPVGYTNEQIGNMLGVTAQTIVLIRQLPEYHAKAIELLSGVTSAWDLEIRQDAEATRAEMKSMVPSAMMVIRNALLSKNENIRVRAAMEVFDREGTHAKVSKSTVSVTNVPNMQADPSVVSNLMQLLASAPTTGPAPDATITSAGSFTVSASDAGKQQKLMESELDNDVLEELDLSTTKPN